VQLGVSVAVLTGSLRSAGAQACWCWYRGVVRGLAVLPVVPSCRAAYFGKKQIPGWYLPAQSLAAKKLSDATHRPADVMSMSSAP